MFNTNRICNHTSRYSDFIFNLKFLFFTYFNNKKETYFGHLHLSHHFLRIKQFKLNKKTPENLYKKLIIHKVGPKVI